MEHAAAGHDQRARAALEQLKGRLHRLRVGDGTVTGIAGQVLHTSRHRPRPVGLRPVGKEDIPGNYDGAGSRAPARGVQERLPQHQGHLVGAERLAGPLDGRPEQERLVRPLRRRAHIRHGILLNGQIADDGQKRGCRMQRFQESQRQQRSAGTHRGVEHPHLARNAGVGRGGIGQVALIAHYDVLHCPRAPDGIIQRQRLLPRDAEDVPYPLGAEDFKDNVSRVHAPTPPIVPAGGKFRSRLHAWRRS